MYKLIGWYNRNRKKIWAFLIAAIIIIAICYYLIEMLTEQNIADNNVQNNNNEIVNNLNSVTLSTQESVVSGNEIPLSSDKLGTIDNFINYCNNQNIEEAYNLLSDECKEEMYPQIDVFKSSYYDQVFGGNKKNVSMENWFGDTYKVDFNEDILATGKYNTENIIQDYITIVRNSNDEYKLNINRYIRRNTSNDTAEDSGITIKVNEINTYMDYGIYEFEVTNNTDSTIKIGDINDGYSMYLIDGNNLQYPSYVNELSEAELLLSSRQTKNIRIKYYNKYSSNKQIKGAIFANIQLNYGTGDSNNTRIHISL